jgi:hypothetical protein
MAAVPSERSSLSHWASGKPRALESRPHPNPVRNFEADGVPLDAPALEPNKTAGATEEAALEPPARGSQPDLRLGSNHEGSTPLTDAFVAPLRSRETRAAAPHFADTQADVSEGANMPPQSPAAADDLRPAINAPVPRRSLPAIFPSRPETPTHTAVLPPSAAPEPSIAGHARNDGGNSSPQPAKALDAESTLPKLRSPEVPPQELQLNLRSEEFGRVQIHTAVKEDRVTAHVAVENAAAQRAIASELPGLHGALAAADLRVDSVTVARGGESHAGSTTSGGGSHPHGERGAHVAVPPVPRPKEESGDGVSQECSINVVV